jgi:hypothetical protein
LNDYVERISAELDEIEKSVRASTGPFVEVNDVLQLLALLRVTTCQHWFVTSRMGGDPTIASSDDRVKVCKYCGFEVFI